MKLKILLAAAVFLAAGCAAGAPATTSPSSPALVDDGREIAQAQCSRCHAVGQSGDSPNPAAPTFRTVFSNYHADVLKEELMEGIRVNHDMPQFQLNPQGVDALVAYLQSIQQPPATQR